MLSIIKVYHRLTPLQAKINLYIIISMYTTMMTLHTLVTIALEGSKNNFKLYRLFAFISFFPTEISEVTSSELPLHSKKNRIV